MSYSSSCASGSFTRSLFLRRGSRSKPLISISRVGGKCSRTNASVFLLSPLLDSKTRERADNQTLVEVQEESGMSYKKRGVCQSYPPRLSVMKDPTAYPLSFGARAERKIAPTAQTEHSLIFLVQTFPGFC